MTHTHTEYLFGELLLLLLISNSINLRKHFTNMSATETFTNVRVGKKTFERFTKLKRDRILLDTQINVSQAKHIILT